MNSNISFLWISLIFIIFFIFILFKSMSILFNQKSSKNHCLSFFSETFSLFLFRISHKTHIKVTIGHFCFTTKQRSHWALVYNLINWIELNRMQFRILCCQKVGTHYNTRRKKFYLLFGCFQHLAISIPIQLFSSVYFPIIGKQNEKRKKKKKTKKQTNAK